MVTAVELIALQAASMSEAAVERFVEQVSRGLGIATFHTHDSRHSQAGFPDYVLVGTRVIYRELKRERVKVPDHQLAAHELLAEAGADIAVWRPSDQLSGRIVAELREIAPPGFRPVVPLARLKPRKRT